LSLHKISNSKFQKSQGLLHKKTQTTKNSFSSLGGNSWSTRRFIPEPSNWATTDASPGGILMPAKRFLGRNPETYVNSLKEKGKSMQSYHGKA